MRLVSFLRGVRQMRMRLAITLLAALASACTSPRQGGRTDETSGALAHIAAAEPSRARQDSINRARPGYVVDSILPLDEDLLRFTADLPSQPTQLDNGFASRDALVRGWIAAVERADSLTLIRLAVNRPEFALLVYPSSPYTRAPMRQSPAIVWRQLSDASIQGFRRTLGRLGGKPLGVTSWSCPEVAEIQGKNRIWRNCAVRRMRSPGDTVSQRLFGPIIERDGRYKFVTLASEM